MNRNFSPNNRLTSAAITLTAVSANVLAQSTQEQRFVEQAGGGWWFYAVLIAVAAIGVTFFVWRKLNTKGAVNVSSNNRDTNYYNSNGSYEMDGLDVDKEMEWLRKAKKSKAKTVARAIPETTSASFTRSASPVDIDTKAFQEKMRKLQYLQLPINSFTEIRPPKLYQPLPVSDDPSLLNAIEQANEEYEEDEVVREVALKVLAAFKSRNSVDSLTQIALYDLSSSLRSKAVSALTDFDHASVFEPILLACADPTREVRAAAARGLFRLSFDRADAWQRIMDTNDEFRMRHAARAAVESGIAVKSFDRLVHEDLKVAREAFALVAFMIGSGETEEIFNAIKNHKDERIKFALLHVLKVRKDEKMLPRLEELKRGSTFSEDVAERMRDTIASLDKVMV